MKKAIVSQAVEKVNVEKFYKNCGDCGKFVEKSQWIPVDNSNGHTHTLCRNCLLRYSYGFDEAM